VWMVVSRLVSPTGSFLLPSRTRLNYLSTLSLAVPPCSGGREGGSFTSMILEAELFCEARARDRSGLLACLLACLPRVYTSPVVVFAIWAVTQQPTWPLNFQPWLKSDR
jgi:hypothetical protein